VRKVDEPGWPDSRFGQSVWAREEICFLLFSFALAPELHAKHERRARETVCGIAAEHEHERECEHYM